MEIVIPIVEPIVSDVGQNLWVLTKRHVRYLFCFKSVIKDFMEEYQKLKVARDHVQQNVESATRNTEVIEENVQKWLKDVDEVIKDVQKLKEEIEENKSILGGRCPNWGCRYRLSRKGEHKRCYMFNLRKSGDFDRVSYPATLPGIEFLASKDFQLFKSAEPAFHQIIEALKNDQTHMIGLYGMGGAGKTTLAKIVAKKVQEEEIFDEVVIIVVSQSPNFKNMQGVLADSLGMKLEEESEEGRAKRLHLRFTKSRKKILVILDDAWKKFDLKSKLGIPFGDDQKCCKILLTTRRENVCIGMRCQPRIILNELDEDEGLELLKKHAGLVDDESHPLNDVAVKVAKECKGLPLAIVTIGSALKEKSIDEWTLVFEKLRKSKLVDIRKNIDVDDDVYAILKVSYDYLEDKESKLCFLLCSLFPEDYEIPLEELVIYGMGLGLFPDADSIEEARIQLRVTVNKLKASCLLMNASEEGFVKVHDVIRDVALGIASQGDDVFMVKAGLGLTEWPKEGRHVRQYTAISLMDNKILKLPDQLACPKLKTLLLSRQYHYGRRRNIEVSDHFFEEMKALKNLCLNCVNLSLKSLEFLKDLKTLELIDCNLKDISSLGNLIRLEILSLRDSLFDEFSKELGALTELRLLDLRGCPQLKRIPSNLIQRFSQLEELYVDDCFDKGEDKETSTTGGSNATLSELNSLSSLAVLFLQEINSKCIPRDFGFVCNKLLRYDICVNTSTRFDDILTSGKRALTVKDIEATSLIVFSALYHTLEYLGLEEVTSCENILPSIDKGGLNKLKSLVLEDCKDLKCIVDTSQLQVPINILSDLVTLSLKRLNLLTEICCGPCGKLQSVSLENLEAMHVEECPDMCTLFPVILLQRLHKLKKVTIRSCNKLEEIFQLDGICHTGEEELVLLSSLVKLELVGLPQLRCIWKGPNDILNFKSLTNVEVSGCKSLIFLFTLSVAQSFVQLKSLKVSDCESLKHLLLTKGVDDKEKETISESDHIAIVLPNLANLIVENIPQLRHIWNGPSYYVNLPSLAYVKVRECKSLTYLFTLSNVRSLLLLKSLDISGCENLEHLVVTKEGNKDKGEEILSKQDHDVECLFFTKLESLNISSCQRLEYIFPISFARVLIQLEKLIIENTPQLKQVFYLDDGREENVIAGDEKALIELPKLKVVRLDGLANIIGFCPENYHSIWPTLEDFTIDKCSNLSTSFVSEVVSKVEDVKENLRILGIGSWNQLYDIVLSWLENGFFKNLEELRINNYGVKVLFELENGRHASSIPYLKKLRLNYLEELEGLWKSPKHVLCLENLTTLYLWHCDRMRNIFSPSLARNLSQLRKLYVYDCGELEEIIVEEAEDNQILFFQNLLKIRVVRCPKIRRVFPIRVAPALQKLAEIFVLDNSELEEVFGNEDVADVMDHKEIVLPQFDWLSLEELPNLTKFCPVGYHFIFPSLTNVLVVRGCPKISTRFSLDQDRSVHAKAKPLTMGKQDESAEFLSEPFIEIECYSFGSIKKKLPPYIENDEPAGGRT